MSDEEFEAYLGQFQAVVPPDGARARILAPALSLAAALSETRRLSFGERVFSAMESLFARPLRVFALSAVLFAGNLHIDGATPRLSHELATGNRAPGTVAATQLRPRPANAAAAGDEVITTRGWFIDRKSFEAKHPSLRQERRRSR